MSKITDRIEVCYYLQAAKSKCTALSKRIRKLAFREFAYLPMANPIDSIATITISQEIIPTNSMPIGVSNSSKNCWSIAALQILCNIPICVEITRSEEFSKDFPKISHFIQCYKTSSPKELGEQIKTIRQELFSHFPDSFSTKNSTPADATEFLNLLLNKFSLNHGYKFAQNYDSLSTLLNSAEEKHLFIEVFNIESQCAVESLFKPTSYELLGFIFYIKELKHYITTVKVSGKWYACDDATIHKINGTHNLTQKEIVLIVASKKASFLIT